jgi:hypothetical protein
MENPKTGKSKATVASQSSSDAPDASEPDDDEARLLKTARLAAIKDKIDLLAHNKLMRLHVAQASKAGAELAELKLQQQASSSGASISGKASHPTGTFIPAPSHVPGSDHTTTPSSVAFQNSFAATLNLVATNGGGHPHTLAFLPSNTRDAARGMYLRGQAIVSGQTTLPTEVVHILQRDPTATPSNFEVLQSYHCMLVTHLQAVHQQWQALATSPTSDNEPPQLRALISSVASQLDGLTSLGLFQKRLLSAVIPAVGNSAWRTTDILDIALDDCGGTMVPHVSDSETSKRVRIGTVFDQNNSMRDRLSQLRMAIQADNRELSASIASKRKVKPAATSKAKRGKVLASPNLTPRGIAMSAYMNSKDEKSRIMVEKICFAFNSEQGCGDPCSHPKKYTHKCAMAGCTELHSAYKDACSIATSKGIPA